MKIILLTILYFGNLSIASYAQESSVDSVLGTKGLKHTEEILNELNLPEWLWSGAHIYKNIEDQYHTVRGDLLSKYFNPIPLTGINDPQKILSSDQQQSITTLTDQHSKVSELKISFNILAPGQQFDLSKTEIKQQLNKLYKNRDAVIIYYYYTSPRETTGYIITGESGIIENWETNELFLNSIRATNIQVEPFQQMEHFLKEFSKRSFWLEKKLIIPQITDHPDDRSTATRQETAPKANSLGATLAENIFTLILMTCVLSLGLWYFLWSTKWRKYVLPLQNPATRLGAEYGANVSNFIEFSNPKSSLNEQYETFKDREL